MEYVILLVFCLIPLIRCDGVIFNTDDFQSICDDCWERDRTSFNYKFFGMDYREIYVSSNGYLTFNEGSTSYNPDFTSAFSGLIMAAPLMSDILNAAGLVTSHITYGEYHDAALLHKANEVINDNFCMCGEEEFNAISLYAATWEEQSSYCDGDVMMPWGDYAWDHLYEHSGSHINGYKRDTDAEEKAEQLAEIKSGNDKRDQYYYNGYYYGYYDYATELPRNTFQIVLATDEERTFAIVNIHKQEWTHCFSHNKMFFNAGDGVRFYLNTDSDYEGNSNVGEDGRWAYRVDGYDIEEPAYCPCS